MKNIIVGSTNPVKIEAVRRVIGRVWADAQIAGVAAESGVRAQPLSDDEAIAGAIQRARHALQLCPADFGIGIEGNTADSVHGMFSTAWVAVIDAQGQMGLGSAGRIALPESLASAIRAGDELGPLMDQLIGETNVKHKQGAIGILTKGLFDRTAALEVGVICALCRFVAPTYYQMI